MIPLIHRADHRTLASQVGFSSYLAVIDFAPNLLDLEQGDLEYRSQCVHCSFFSFLAGVERLQRFQGLRQILMAFQHYLKIYESLSQGNSDTLSGILNNMGVRGCFEILHPGHPIQFPKFPKIRVVHQKFQELIPQEDTSHQDWVLIEPNHWGVSWLQNQVNIALELGYRKILLGYLEHAAAIDQWSDFCESRDFEITWKSFMIQLKQMSVEEIGFTMGYPPCASLQWKDNKFLEQLRANLDLQFRRMEDTSSLMCPENVSGYTLTNDLKPFLTENSATTTGMAVKMDRLLLLF